MFLHRKKELEVLNNGGSALIYGKRRVGKTSLIKEYLKNVNKPCYYFECLRASLEENMEFMISDMMRNGILKFNISFSNFYDLFQFINSNYEKIIFVIDKLKPHSFIYM